MHSLIKSRKLIRLLSQITSKISLTSL